MITKLNKNYLSRFLLCCLTIFVIASLIYLLTTPKKVSEHELNHFIFVNHHKQPFTLDSFSGTPVIVSFTFTKCIMYCSGQVIALKKLRSQLLNNLTASDFEFVSISLTPETSTPEELNDFAKRFSVDEYSNWHFATAGKDETDALIDAIDVKVSRGSKEDQINHSTFVYLLNREGQFTQKFEGLPLDFNSLLAALTSAPNRGES